jgi:hypothetical protein
VAPAEAIESGSVLNMRDATADALLAELNGKRKRRRFLPGVAFSALFGIVLLSTRLPSWATPILAVVGLVAVLASWQLDLLRKSTVVMYDLDPDATASYQGLIDAVSQIRQAQRVWHVESRAVVLDARYHAGAQSEITRSPTNVKYGAAPFVKCNVDVPFIEVGRQSLYFFPERLLVFDSRSVGAVAYDQLVVGQQLTQFIEEENVPSDSRVVGQTWRYVNKGGGPDRRFRDNRELPICEYEALHFQSNSGLNELLHVSRKGVGDALVRYLSFEGPRLAQLSRNSAFSGTP